ncbi:MAG: 6-bladed beta-propeller [Gammaproteobacteria bacterium]|nr:6-bladed beta-propeller [Gammaproteobacteria bacterium]
MIFGHPLLFQHSFSSGCVRPLMLFVILTGTGAMLGCATSTPTSSNTIKDTSELVWPLPPEQPRIKFVRTLHSEDQIITPKSTMSSLRSSLLGQPAESGRQLKKPYAVHVDNKERVFVADSGWGKVLVFDEQNKSFSIWGTHGKGILAKPLGITSDGQGNIYVTDSVKQRVVVFDTDGEFLRAMGQKGELDRPIGIAVDDERNRVYVVDSKAHHIVVYNKAGEHIDTLGKRGEKPEEFNWPTNIALSSSGNLYVTDSMNFRIQILKPDGTLHKTFGENGDGRGKFVRPKGIAVNSLGHIYVADAAFNNIQIFDNEGTLLLDVGTHGSEPGHFILPAGLYIDQQDRIYVADQYNFRIQVFQYLKKENLETLNKNSANGDTAASGKITQKHDHNDQEKES